MKLKQYWRELKYALTEGDGTCGCLLIAIFLGIILFIGSIFLGGWLIMLLWNWLAPIFWKSAPILTYWQGVGVGIFINIVLGGGLIPRIKFKQK